MIVKLGNSLINLDEILCVLPQKERPHVADVFFRNGKQISIGVGDQSVSDWVDQNAPPPGWKPPPGRPKGPKG